jgi:hypothetical protein
MFIINSILFAAYFGTHALNQRLKNKTKRNGTIGIFQKRNETKNIWENEKRKETKRYPAFYNDIAVVKNIIKTKQNPKKKFNFPHILIYFEENSLN